MPAGLKLINDYGTTQIDETYHNYLLRSKGSVTTTGPDASQGMNACSATIQVSGTHPQVFFEASGAYICPGGRTISGSVHTFTIYTDVPATLTYYVFDLNVPAVAGNFGLQVFTGLGTLAYSSANRPMGVVSILSLASGSYFDVSPNGRKLAAALSFSRNNLQTVGVVGSQPRIGFCHDSIRYLGSSVDAKRLVVKSFLGSFDMNYPFQTNYPPQIILIDVTNI